MKEHSKQTVKEQENKHIKEHIREHSNDLAETPETTEAAKAIAEISKNMEKNQYYLLCQYAIGIVEAKAKIIDEQLSTKYGREIMRSLSGRVKSPESIYAKLLRKELPTDLETAKRS